MNFAGTIAENDPFLWLFKPHTTAAECSVKMIAVALTGGVGVIGFTA